MLDGVEIILFFPDTGAEHPLWSGDEEGGLLDLDDLPLSAGLRSDLEAWADEAGWPDNYIGRAARLKDLQLAGRVLCARTSSELGPNFDVRWSWDYS
jgi:hypothetical protein